MSKRLWELDALRGLMLVLMTLTHLPTRLTTPTGQPFGYVSAAEGFVLLSAFMAGMVYSRRGLRDGLRTMRKSLRERAIKVYLCQVATLVFLFTVFAALAVRREQPAATGLLSFYFEHPVMAWFSSLALIYGPPLLDILPIYVLFMAASPAILSRGLRHGWSAILTASAILWFASQFGFGNWLYEVIAQAIDLRVPLSQTGSFSIWAWQFLWIMGLWMGSTRAQGQTSMFEFPRWSVMAAVVVSVFFLTWRHYYGQAPFGADMVRNLWFEKWTLGPLRMVNLFALIIVTVEFGPWLMARLPRLRVLETLGQASLPVFCAHLVFVLLVLGTQGGDQYARPWWGDALLLAGCFGSLYAVAWVTLWCDRRRAAKGLPVRAKPASGATVPVAPVRRTSGSAARAETGVALPSAVKDAVAGVAEGTSLPSAAAPGRPAA